jgi:peptide/nickel transport system permease protein
MLAFIIQRLGQAAIVMLTVAVVSFSLFNFVGDPVNNMVGIETNEKERNEIRESLGLNDPIYVQFFNFVRNALRGQFGVSYRLTRPVKEIILERMPATLELSLVAAAFALLVGIPMGVYTALYTRNRLSSIFLTVSLIGISLPTFVIGILLILVFSVNLGWLPSFGRGETVSIGRWTSGLFSVSGLKAIIMPAITLGLFQMTLIMRLVRAEMLEVLRTDYIKFARARGLPNRVVNFGHALKNTLVPVITIAGLQLGNIIAFSIIVETVFQWPGLGQLIIQAIQFADVPMMAAYLVMIGLIFVIINLVVDLLYYAVDPRMRIVKVESSNVDS